MRYVMGIDVGTGTTKGVIIDETCRIIASAQTAHTMENPAPGWFEMDAETIWWGDLCKISRELLEQSKISGASIKALGLSALGCDCVPVDQDGNALCKAILYGIDSRSSEEIQWLNEYYKDQAEAVFGHDICSSDIAPKILWIKNHLPHVYEKADKFLTASSFLTMKLTGRCCIDRYLAEDFLPLYDLKNNCVSEKGCGLFCRPDQLAELMDATEIAGTVTAAAAIPTGLPAGTPVLTGTGDSGAEAVSTGVFRPGDLMVQLGSTAYFVCLADHLIQDSRVWPGTFIIPGVYSVCAGTNTAGTLTNWFREKLFFDLDADTAFTEMAKGIENIPAGSEGLMVLPYFAGERTPLNDPKARGIFFGMTLSHTREHLYRAALEGIAYSIDQHVRLFEDNGILIKKIMAVGGGTKNRTWLQIIADVLSRPIYTAGVTMGAAYGDALMAALAAGFYDSWDALSRVIEPKETYLPNEENAAYYAAHKALFARLYDDNRESMHSLAGEN